MSSRLLITNGTSAVEQARAAGFDAVFCPWDDVLHDGPVPGALDAVALSEVRARFIADADWESVDEARARFQRRDALLEEDYDEIICWFEHDLYDQLQLIQVLDRLRTRPDTPVLLAQCDTFIGLQSRDEVQAGLSSRAPVTTRQFSAAASAWSAFRQQTPVEVQQIVREPSAALPHLRTALHRWLASFPGVHDGLSRTEREVLALINQGLRTPVRLFQITQSGEQAAFRGDASFLLVLRNLGAHPKPLIATTQGGLVRSFDEPIQLTRLGEDVALGRADAIRSRGINAWRGGTHLTLDHVWRWSPTAGLVG